MRHAAQAPSHYEIELRQADRQNERTGAAWRTVRRVGPDRSMEAAQACAKRMNRQETRVVAVEHGGWRRTADAAEG